ncbi:MAG: valine--tRNA ligase [Promethearchaeota archaeon]
MEWIRISKQKNLIEQNKHTNAKNGENHPNLQKDTTFPKRFQFGPIEAKWKAQWKQEKIYQFSLTSADTHDNIFSIDTPPDFTSGNLHMGHILNHSWIDFMARFQRSQGKNVYFPQGFDCHGLPTELKVQKMTGLDPKNDRNEFLHQCHQFTEKFIENMTKQFTDIGYSTDWDCSYRTMDPNYIRLVQLSLLQFYKKGLLYRAKHPVHWCPQCHTSLAKQEVGYIETTGKLWEIKLPLHDRHEEYITIATTRPEMIEACIAVFIHPSDERYAHLSAATVEIPLTDRQVPIIMDSEVDMAFGTGAVYCCTFGDETDILWQRKHHLPIYQIFTQEGNMAEGTRYAGLSTLDARYRILESLTTRKLLGKAEKISHRVIAHTERSSCQTPIEYLPVPQWFINVTEFTKQIANDGRNLKWYPDLSRRLTDWCDTLTWDWVVSRQRTFGTPIPFWYCSNPECNHVILPTPKELPMDPSKQAPPYDECPICHFPIKGETDVCDCWVDSSITPLAISRWDSDDDFFNTIYPLTNRPQGYEIIRTWMFYTLYRCRQLTGIPPFSETMINGMVAGPDGRKMSKSFGNVVTPDEVLPRYGADAVRLWAALGPPGQDYPFQFDWVHRDHPTQKVGKQKISQEMKKIRQGKLSQLDFDARFMKEFPTIRANAKFITKIWNAYRLLWTINESSSILNLSIPTEKLTPIDEFALSELNRTQELVKEAWKSYRWKDGWNILRQFFKHLLCDQYLEAIKWRWHHPDSEIKSAALQIAYVIFYDALKMFGIILPFITEEIFVMLYQQWVPETSLHLTYWPKPQTTIDISELQAKKTQTSFPNAKLGRFQIKILALLRAAKSKAKIPLNASIERVKILLRSNEWQLNVNDITPITEPLKIQLLEITPKTENNPSIHEPEAYAGAFHYEDATIPAEVWLWKQRISQS